MEVLIAIGALFAIGPAIFLCIAAFRGAVMLIEYAAEQKFVGLAAYVACWVFLFPVMLVASVLIGIYRMLIETEQRQIARPPTHARMEQKQEGRGRHIKEPADVWKKPASVT